MGEQLSRDVGCSCTDPIRSSIQEQPQTDVLKQSNLNILTTEKKQQNPHPQYNPQQDLQQTVNRSKIFNDQGGSQIIQTSNLILTVVASATLAENSKYIITPNGLQEQPNQQKIVYFGCKYQKDNRIVNQIVIPCVDKSVGDKHRGNHFQIRYNDGNYRIKDLGQGFGCFRRVDQLTIRNNTVLNFGQVYCIANTAYGQDIIRISEFNNLYDIKEFFIDGYPCDRNTFLKQDRKQAFLRLSIYGGSNRDEKYMFSSNQYMPIIIGRSTDCLIRLHDDGLVSKYQCTIYFDGCWTMIDGIQGKQSTNGTWVYIDQEVSIIDGMQIKANNTILQASFQ